MCCRMSEGLFYFLFFGGEGSFLILLVYLFVLLLLTHTFFLYSLADIESIIVAQPGPELSTILPKAPGCWDSRPKLTHLT